MKHPFVDVSSSKRFPRFATLVDVGRVEQHDRGDRQRLHRHARAQVPRPQLQPPAHGQEGRIPEPSFAHRASARLQLDHRARRRIVHGSSQSGNVDADQERNFDAEEGHLQKFAQSGETEAGR